MCLNFLNLPVLSFPKLSLPIQLSDYDLYAFLIFSTNALCSTHLPFMPRLHKAQRAFQPFLRVTVYFLNMQLFLPVTSFNFLNNATWRLQARNGTQFPPNPHNFMFQIWTLFVPPSTISIHPSDRQSSWCHTPVHAIMFPTGSVPTNGAQVFWAAEWVIRRVWWWCWRVFWLRTTCWITEDTAVANAKWAETLATTNQCCNFTYQLHELLNGTVSIRHYQLPWEEGYE